RMSDPQSTKRKGEEMSDASVKKHKDALTIMLPIERKLPEGEEQISQAHVFDGKIRRLHVKKGRANFSTRRERAMMVSVHCEGDELGDLWRIRADMQLSYEQKGNDTLITLKKLQADNWFFSWKCDFELPEVPNATKTPTISISVSINISHNESFARRPILNSKLSINDVILVPKGKKVSVNKQFLATQSSYFNSLFFGNFKESEQKEIEIKDTNPEVIFDHITRASAL
ncbi:hypothetical protein PENTCL1PPCAC_13168, partial [Pristionchus entomophagus]